MDWIRGRLPILTWLPKYSREDFRGDLVAGLTLPTIVIPMSMAYAFLAGVPAQYGIYTSILPTFVFAIFSTSRHLSIGTFTLVSLLINSGLESSLQKLFPGHEQHDISEGMTVAIVMSLTFMVGIMKFGLSVLRLGSFLSQNLLPDCFVSGLTSATAFIIATSQMRNLLRVTLPNRSTPFRLIESWVLLLENIRDAHIPTLLFGILTVASIYFIRVLNGWLKRWHEDYTKERLVINQQNETDAESAIDAALIPLPARPKRDFRPNFRIFIPDYLFGTLVSCASAYAYNSTLGDRYGLVDTIPVVPRGLPTPTISFLPSHYCQFVPAGYSCPLFQDFALSLVFAAFKTALVSATLSFAVIQLYAKRFQYLRSVNLDQDLFAMAMCSLICPLVGQSFVASGSLSRSSQWAEMGGRTQLTGVLTGLILLVIIVTPFTKLLQFICLPSLAAVILVSLVNLFFQIDEGLTLIRASRLKTPEQKHLHNRAEATIWWVTFIGVFVFDIDVGMFIGIGSCVLLLTYNRIFPHFRDLGMFGVTEAESANMSASMYDLNVSENTGKVVFLPLDVFRLRTSLKHRTVYAADIMKETLSPGISENAVLQRRDLIRHEPRIHCLHFTGFHYFKRLSIIRFMLDKYLAYEQSDHLIILVDHSKFMTPLHLQQLANSYQRYHLNFVLANYPESESLPGHFTSIYLNVAAAYNHIQTHI